MSRGHEVVSPRLLRVAVVMQMLVVLKPAHVSEDREKGDCQHDRENFKRHGVQPVGEHDESRDNATEQLIGTMDFVQLRCRRRMRPSTGNLARPPAIAEESSSTPLAEFRPLAS
jgi:hypothetical protein